MGGEASVQLIGRGRELALMERALDSVSAGTPSVVAVTGEPGIGKTTLVEAFLQSLESNVQNEKERQKAKGKNQKTKVELPSPAPNPQPPAPKRTICPHNVF